MDDRKRRLLDIIQAFEKVRLASPARGPGWSICFQDEDERLLAAFTLDSYQQVDEISREVAPLGFGLIILEQAERSSDFVFRPDTLSADRPLLRPAAAGRTALRHMVLPPLNMARDKPLEQGALVMQDSGGPVMLLSALSRDLAYCVWFCESAQVRSGTFMVNRLVNVDTARRQLGQATELAHDAQR